MFDLTPTERKAIAAATEAQKHAYAPYSGRFVGAAVVTSEGDVFAGCNLENKDTDLRVCAERSAISTAVSNGQRAFALIVVVSPDDRFWPPCDKCRPVIREFAPYAEVLMVTKGGDLHRGRLDALPSLPFSDDGQGAPK